MAVDCINSLVDGTQRMLTVSDPGMARSERSRRAMIKKGLLALALRPALPQPHELRLVCGASTPANGDDLRSTFPIIGH